MRRRVPGMLTACAALLLLAACQGEPDTAMGTQRSDPQVDATFLSNATRNGLALVDFARLAETKAKDASVRNLAAQTIQEHTAIARQLTQFAQSLGQPLPYSMDPERQRFYQQLQSLNGFAFDRTYVERQLQNQTMAIQAFQSEADSGKDPKLRSFAQQTLPVLQGNLREFLAHGGINPGLPGEG